MQLQNDTLSVNERNDASNINYEAIRSWKAHTFEIVGST